MRHPKGKYGFILNGRKEHHVKDHNYTQKATFFLTFNTYKAAPILCNIHPTTAQVELTTEGHCVENALHAASHYYSFLTLDLYVIMPTHIHALFIFEGQPTGKKHITANIIIGRIKAHAGYQIRQSGCSNFAWQHDFYDIIIRDQQELAAIQNYIIDNPKNWLKET